MNGPRSGAFEGFKWPTVVIDSGVLPISQVFELVKREAEPWSDVQLRIDAQFFGES